MMRGFLALALFLASPLVAATSDQKAEFGRSLRGSPYLVVPPGMPVGGVISPTRCRIEAGADGSLEVRGPGATGALTCQVTISWSEHPRATRYESVITVPSPCARARGATVGRTSQILAFVVSPYATCGIKAVVFAVDSFTTARIDSTNALIIIAAGSRAAR
jgi:hypothetical protein